MPYLLPDSSIIYPFRVPFPSMTAGGVGGGIQKQTWYGEILWEYIFSDSIYQHHHDIDPMPNGNILVLAWERHTLAQGDDTESFEKYLEAKIGELANIVKDRDFEDQDHGS